MRGLSLLAISRPVTYVRLPWYVEDGMNSSCRFSGGILPLILGPIMMLYMVKFEPKPKKIHSIPHRLLINNFELQSLLRDLGGR